MDIQESVDLILKRQGLIAEEFYEHLFDRYPEARPYFAGLDMKRQVVMLSMVLLLVVHHYRNRFATSESYLRVLGHTHATRRQVPEALLEPFCECLIETLARVHGESWTETLAAQWREALDMAVKLMKEGYHSHVTA